MFYLDYFNPYILVHKFVLLNDLYPHHLWHHSSFPIDTSIHLLVSLLVKTLDYVNSLTIS